MISAFARPSQVLGDPVYLAAANKAADFARKNLYDSESHTLRRSYREGASGVHGFASDYAFLIRGLLDLYAADFDISRVEWALQLQDEQRALFWDENSGGYFSITGQDKNVLLRMKDEGDGAEPSPNSVAALDLLRLSAMLDQRALRAQPKQIVIAGKPNAADTAAMRRAVHHPFLPNKVLILADGGAGQK